MTALPAQSATPVPQWERAASEILAQSNSFRRSEGLPALSTDRALNTAAQAFAAYMARTDQYGHEADGRQPADRARAQGYDYCMVAENIAMLYSSAGFETVDLATRFVQGWIHSPGHRRNLLAAEATDIGLGVAQSASSGRFYAVQLFGRPARLRWSFSLSNRSRTAVGYQLDDKGYRLPAGVTRTHEQCGTPALSVRLPGNDRATSLEPTSGTQYRIEGADRGLRITESH